MRAKFTMARCSSSSLPMRFDATGRNPKWLIAVSASALVPDSAPKKRRYERTLSRSNPRSERR